MSTVNNTKTGFSKAFENADDMDKAVAFVQHRTVHGAKTNDHIADFLKKYADIQTEFAKKVDRLVKHSHPSSAELGTFDESWNTFIKLIATEGLQAANSGEQISKALEPAVRNSKSRKEVQHAFETLYGDSKTLSKHSYKSKALNAFDKLEDIEEDRLTRLRESIGQIGQNSRQGAANVAAVAEKLNDQLASFDPAQDVESYLAQVQSGDIKFPDLSPANSAGYTTPAPNRYASPELSPQASNGGHGIRPQASPFQLQEENKQSKLKKLFGKN